MIHRPTTPGAIVYSDGKPPNNEGRGYYQVNANGKEEYLPNGIKPGEVFWEENGKYNQDGQQMGNEFIVGDDGKPIAFQWVPTQVPVGGSTLLQSYVTVYHAVNQEMVPVAGNGIACLKFVDKGAAQVHHILSNKIIKELEQHPTLGGHLTEKIQYLSIRQQLMKLIKDINNGTERLMMKL